MRLKTSGKAELLAVQFEVAIRLFKQSLAVHSTAIVQYDLALAGPVRRAEHSSIK